VTRTLDWWVKWIATAVGLIHVIAVANDIYPYYKFTGLLTAVLWTWLGQLWREPSMIILNVVIMAIYLQGIIKIL
jgi:hypothetical protein